MAKKKPSKKNNKEKCLKEVYNSPYKITKSQKLPQITLIDYMSLRNHLLPSPEVPPEGFCADEVKNGVA